MEQSRLVHPIVRNNLINLCRCQQGKLPMLIGRQEGQGFAYSSIYTSSLHVLPSARRHGSPKKEIQSRPSTLTLIPSAFFINTLTIAPTPYPSVREEFLKPCWPAQVYTNSNLVVPTFTTYQDAMVGWL